jgi:hypothetical protein
MKKLLLQAIVLMMLVSVLFSSCGIFVPGTTVLVNNYSSSIVVVEVALPDSPGFDTFHVTPNGKVSVVYQKIGFSSRNHTIRVTHNTNIDINLRHQINLIEVIVFP